jgi:hypothetical protein
MRLTRATQTAGEDCVNTGNDDDKYCDLNAGGYIDAQHFTEGMFAFDEAYAAWKSAKGGAFSVVIHPMNEDINDPDTFKLTFSAGPMSEEEFIAAFIYWYAYTYQPAYEASQPTATSFSNEDIPSAVLGAYTRSQHPKRHVVKWDNEQGKYVPTPYGQELFIAAMDLLGGGTRGEHLLPSGGPCPNDFGCGSSTTSLNPNPFLKISRGDGYWYILWPNMPELNVILSSPNSGIMGPR